MSPVLRVNGLSVALPRGAHRQFAVEDVSFTLGRGETLCIIGASGSGKSVLASSMLLGLAPGLRMTTGEIVLGKIKLTDLAEPDLRRLRGNRIALIPQEPIAALNPLMTVGRQISEVFALHTNVNAATRQARTLELLEAVALSPATAERYPHQLSGGECQRVAIAMAVALNPDVLIADEATTALDTVTQAQALQLLAGLKSRANYGLIFISHDIAVVRSIADRIIVIDHGRIVEAGAAQDVLHTPQHPVTVAMLEAACPAPPRVPKPPTDPVLVVSELTKTYGSRTAVAAASFTLGRCRTLAIVGASGSGKSTLARMIMRIIKPESGVVTVDGANAYQTPRSAVQMIFQDSLGALNPRRTVGDSITRAAELRGSDRGTARARAVGLLARVGLPPDAFARLPTTFSGGQRQRIAIARALAMQPKVLICDESVSGLDPVIQNQVLALLAELQSQFGIAVLFITHDLRTAAFLADDVIVMEEGQIVEAGDAATVLSSPQSDAAKALVAAMPRF